MSVEPRPVRGLVVTIPKSGTHLVDSVLARVPNLKRQERTGLNRKLQYHPLNFVPFVRGEPCLVGIGRPRTARMAAVTFALGRIRKNHYAMSQLPFDTRVAQWLQRHDYRVVVGVRDPRDVLVSLVHHILARPAHFLHDVFQAMPSDRARLAALIDGIESSRGERRDAVSRQLELVAGWLDSPGVLRVRFEDLIGERGGGSEATQVRSIMQLAEHLRRPVDAEKARRIGIEMFGSGRTFRRGAIGAWRNHFDDALHDRFLKLAGHLLPAFGYEAHA